MNIVKVHNPFQRHKGKREIINVDEFVLEDVCRIFFDEIKKKYGYVIDYDKAGDYIAVSVNGLIIPQQFWCSYNLKEEDFVVMMPVVGKGDTEKQITNIVLMVALVAVAPGIGLSLAGGTAGTMSLVYTAAIVVGGGMLMNSLTPRPSQKSPDFDTSELSQTFGWEPATMQRQGLAVPRFYGKNKMFGNVIATHTELELRTGYPNDTTDGEDNDQRLNALFGLCMGPIKGVLEPPDIRYLTTGTIALNSRPNVEVYFRNLSVVDLPDENDLYTAAAWAVDIGTPPGIGNWTVNDIGTTHAPSNWTSVAGAPDYVKEDSLIRGPAIPTDYTLGLQGTIITYDNGGAWTDYKVSVDIYAQDDDDLIGVVFRYVDDDNHYRFEIYFEKDTPDRFARLVKRKNGVDSLLWNSFDTYNFDTWYTVEIACEGTQISISIGGSVVAEITDSEPQIKLNEQAIANFRGVSYETKNGLLAQDYISFFEKTITELAPYARVINGSPFVYETPDSEFDDLEIDISFPSGLYDATAGLDNLPVVVKIEIKKATDPEWAYQEITQSTENIVAKVAAKVIRTYSTIRRTITDITKANPGVVTCAGHGYTNGDSIPITDVVGMVEVNDRTQTIANVTLNTFSIEDTSGHTAYTSNGIAHKALGIEYGNKYNIKVTKVSSEQNNASKGDDLYIDRVREVIDNQFTYPRTAMVGVRALATDQLSGTIGFSCIIRGLYVRVYDDSTETWSIEYSTNPAWVIADLLTQPVYSGEGSSGDPFVVERYDAVNPSRLDLDKFVELADFCDQEVVNEDTVNIVEITQAGEAEVETTSPHDFYPDDVVEFTDIHGMIEITDGTQATVISVISNVKFTMDIDSSGYTAFRVPTRLLLHFNGVDAINYTNDESVFNHYIGFNGTAQLDTAVKKWGTASLLLDGNSDYLEVVASDQSDSERFDVCENDVDDWCVECQVKHTDHVGDEVYLSHYEDASNYWRFYHVHGEGLRFEMVSGGVTKIECRPYVMVGAGVGTAVGTMTTNDPPQGVDDAFDGTLTGVHTNAGTAYEANVALAKIGKDWGGGGSRVIQKVIVYGSSDVGFCQTDATYKLQLYGGDNADLATGKVLLGTAQDTDASSLEIEIVATDVSTAYRYHWVEVSGIEGNNNDKVCSELQFFVLAAGSLKSEITDNNWHHAALCKVADEYGVYLDGTQKCYVQDSDNDTFEGELVIGRHGDGSGYFDGSIDEVRVYKGNPFTAAPNNTPDDTITVPTAEHVVEDLSIVAKVKHFIEFNGGFDSGTTVWEAALKVGEIARCVPFFNGTTITLAIDKADSAVQMFTVGNIKEGSFREMFMPQEEIASEIEIHYRDAKQDFKRVPFTIFNVSLDNDSNKVRLDLFGITDATMAEEAGNIRLLKNQYLKRLIEFDADVDAITCVLGDIVRVQHDMTDYGEMRGEGDERYGGGGYVISSTNVTNAVVIVDRDLTFQPGIGGDVTYVLLIRLSHNDSVETKTVTGYNPSTGSITVSGEFSYRPAKGDVFAVGRENLAVKEFTVLDISQTSEQKFKIGGIEYNALVYAGDP